MPLVTSEAASPSASSIGLFDHAMSSRRPSFVSQWPTCGLETPVFHT
jgi:hypothetical protein